MAKRKDKNFIEVLMDLKNKKLIEVKEFEKFIKILGTYIVIFYKNFKEILEPKEKSIIYKSFLRIFKSNIIYKLLNTGNNSC